MARGITEAQVFEAADRLLARGQRPTIERVRQELGRGSPNTVNPMLDAWWAALSRRIGGVQAPELPPALLEACRYVYEALRAQVGGEGKQALAERESLLQEAERTLQHAQAALAAEKAGVQAAVEALRGELEQLRHANEALHQRAGAQQAELAATQGRLEEATARAEQAKRVQVQAAAAAQAELARVRDQYEGNERRWLREIDELREAGRSLRSERERLRKELLARIEAQQRELAAGVKAQAGLRQAREAAEGALAREREKRHFAEGALAAGRVRPARNSRGVPTRGVSQRQAGVKKTGRRRAKNLDEKARK